MEDNQIPFYYNQRWVRKMNDNDSLPKRHLNVLLVTTICAAAFAIVFFILLSTLGFIGFDDGTPITTTCPASPAYYSKKYASTNLMVKTAYIFSILCLVCCLGALGIMVKCVLSASGIEESEFFISKAVKVSLYVFTCLANMSVIPCFGYYLSVICEINGCTNTYDSSRLSALVAISAALLAILLLLFMLLFVFFYRPSEQKYREVQSHPTEPNDTKVEKAEEIKYFNKKHIERDEPYKKQPEIYEKRTPQELQKISPPKREVTNRVEELQHTKEQLFNSPSRRPPINTYSKEVDPQPILIPSPQKRYEPLKDPSSIAQPRTYSKQSYPFESSNKYASPARRENDGELMFYKPRGREMGNDDEDFSKEQSRFLNKYDGRPILSGGTRGQIQGSFTRGELPKKVVNYSPSKVSREGNLVNYIRGKYAG